MLPIILRHNKEEKQDIEWITVLIMCSILFVFNIGWSRYNYCKVKDLLHQPVPDCKKLDAVKNSQDKYWKDRPIEKP